METRERIREITLSVGCLICGLPPGKECSGAATNSELGRLHSERVADAMAGYTIGLENRIDKLEEMVKDSRTVTLMSEDQVFGILRKYIGRILGNGGEKKTATYYGRPERTGNVPEWTMMCPDPLCPSHRRARMKLYINVQRGTGLCFRCETYYSILDIIREFELCSWEKAKEILRDWEGVTIPEDGVLSVLTAPRSDANSKQVPEPPPHLDLPSEFIPVRPSDKLPSYILTRMTKKQAVLYRVGWCMEGMYANRMIIPVYMPDGIRGFVARLMVAKPKYKKKVRYPKGMKTSLCLFNYPNGRKHKQVVVVEGAIDAIAGGLNYMAAFGTKLSRKQIQLLRDSAAKDIVLMFDPDARMKAFKLARILSASVDANVRVAYTEKDPDEYDEEGRRTLVEEAREPGITGLLASA